MDAQVIGIAPALPSLPSVDLYVPTATTGQHIVPIITGDQEEQQQAQVLCQMIKGMIPQLPGVGPDWVAFLTDKLPAPLGQIDAQIRANLALGGHSDYYPDYDAVNDGLTVVATKQQALTEG